jgi:hypothetical protein
VYSTHVFFGNAPKSSIRASAGGALFQVIVVSLQVLLVP